MTLFFHLSALFLSAFSPVRPTCCPPVTTLKRDSISLHMDGAAGSTGPLDSYQAWDRTTPSIILAQGSLEWNPNVASGKFQRQETRASAYILWRKVSHQWSSYYPAAPSCLKVRWEEHGKNKEGELHTNILWWDTKVIQVNNDGFNPDQDQCGRLQL